MAKQLKTIQNKVEISFHINGRLVTKQIPSGMLLIDLVREELNLLGTKPGCMEGECGACSVLIDGHAINSCITFAVNIDGKQLTTIEGLTTPAGLDPVQEAMIQHGAVQCGFCSSGMAINIKSMQHKSSKSGKKPTREQIQKNLEGNLCRCTGYVKIIDAAEEVLSR